MEKGVRYRTEVAQVEPKARLTAAEAGNQRLKIG